MPIMPMECPFFKLSPTISPVSGAVPVIFNCAYNIVGMPLRKVRSIEWMGNYLMADFMNFPMPRERVLRSGNTVVGVIPDICLISHFQVGSWQVLYRPAVPGNVKRWGSPLR